MYLWASGGFMAEYNLRPDALIGKQLPQIELQSSTGGAMRLPDDLKGKWTLLYFYPKDDTPGCTQQACAYRDTMEEFKRINVQVIGVSGDDLKSHQAFTEKHQLNFPLLTDSNFELSDVLGVYGDQTWKGNVYKGLSRDTFLIDPEGKIRQVWRKVRPEATVGETFETIQGLTLTS
jgi:thioredoxin-dependent peroxiredoxin